MDPLTISALLSGYKIYSKLDAEIAKSRMKNSISSINRKLDLLNAKSDQMITREIKSAFDAIDDALESSNKETREIRLKYSEECLLKNTRLDPSLPTEGRQNNEWIALANFGLAYICIMRQDQELAAKHLLRTFLYDPRAARTELLSDIYSAIFKPKCNDLFQWHKEECSKVDNKDFNIEIFLDKTVAAGAGCVAIGAAVIGSSPYLRGLSYFSSRNMGDWAQKKWNTSTSENKRRVAKIGLSIELESKIDIRCKSIAESLIK